MSLVFEYDMPELKTDDGKTVPDSTAKFVLLALADHANDEGEGAYPGVKRICKKTSMSSQTVCNALNALRHSGYTTLAGKSKVDTNSYTINLEKLQPLEFQPLESADSSENSSRKNPVIPADRVKPSFNHTNNHEINHEEARNPLFSLYENNIGFLTPIMADGIEKAEKTYSAFWVAEAIEIAGKNGAKSWRYCETILERWKREGKAERKNGKQKAAVDPKKYITGEYADFIEH
jgi:DnaD/phage-associated family protein